MGIWQDRMEAMWERVGMEGPDSDEFQELIDVAAKTYSQKVSGKKFWNSVAKEAVTEMEKRFAERSPPKDQEYLDILEAQEIYHALQD